MEKKEHPENKHDGEKKHKGKRHKKGPPAEKGPVDGGVKHPDEELSGARKEAGENLDKFLRKCADLDNYKKRVEKEKADQLRFANERLIRALLPVIDNLERAMEHSAQNDENALTSLREGIKITLAELYSELKKFGLEPVRALGERFDPSMHEAISHEETCEVEEDTVINEFSKGYRLFERLLRPSVVAVSKRPEEEEKEENGL